MAVSAEKIREIESKRAFYCEFTSYSASGVKLRKQPYIFETEIALQAVDSDCLATKSLSRSSTSHNILTVLVRVSEQAFTSRPMEYCHIDERTLKQTPMKIESETVTG
jgi:hypothetical protein